MKKVAEVAEVAEVTQIVNNPGGGDCGFYAFSIGLIAIIQKEHALNNGTSATFEKWVAKGLNSVELDVLLGIDLQDLTGTSKLLFSLQMSLRTIVAEASKQDLLTRIESEKKPDSSSTLVQGSPIFSQFVEIVDAYRSKQTTFDKIARFFGIDPFFKIVNFNGLALSEPIQSLAKKLAEELGPESIVFSTHELISETKRIKEVFIDEGNRARIWSGVDVIKRAGRWATHTDLTVVAAELDVNLVVTGEQNGRSLENQPTVTLNNCSNVHWTTTVPARIAVSQVSPPILEKDHSSDSYKTLLAELIHFASKEGVFSSIEKKDLIEIKDLNTATAKTGETDEAFALRLQEAEYRRSGLK